MYSKDTRTLKKGDIYVAIKGELFDGHQFVEQALAQGAAKVIVSQPVDAPASQVIQVEDTLDYLIQEAQKRIQTFQPKIVAITGSVGKTSTRTAIAQLLRTRFTVVEPEGNLNTPLGVALTILNGLTQPNSICVLEMGARFVGDIDELSTLFQPDISVVTNVYGVHLETFGSMENIAHEKGMLVENLSPHGIACLNFDNPHTQKMAERNKGQTLYFSATSAEAPINPSLLEKPYPLLGSHAVYLLLAAYAVGEAIGMNANEIREGLSNLKSPKGRLSKLAGKSGSILIDDTYNASPAATESALKVLQEFDAKRYAFIGDMLELGEKEAEEHLHIAITAFDCADEVFLVGPRMKVALNKLKPNKPFHHFDNALDCVAQLAQNLIELDENSVCLVKGSQGMRMEHISKALLSPALNPQDVLVRQESSWLKD